MRSRALLAALVGGLLSGPVAPLQAGPPGDLAALAQETGLSLERHPGDPPPAVQERVRSLLARPLTLEAAVQVALRSSRRVQALLQESQVARADLRRGRALPNPEVEASLRDGEDTHGEIAVLGDVYGVALYPLKRGLANARYRQARLDLADGLLVEITAVKTAYFELQALLQTRVMLQAVLDGAEAAAELASRQRQAGNISRLEQSLQESLRQEARLALLRVGADLEAAQEGLGQLLGIPPAQWTLTGALPDLPVADPLLDDLERQALVARADLAAARQEADAAQRALTLARLEWLPSLKAGIFTEQDPEDRRLAGPIARIEVPLFDLGFPARARARAERDRARHELAALETQVRSQVRATHARLTAARAVADTYRQAVIPLRQNAVADLQQQYNYMIAGVYQLLDARREEVGARRESLLALRDYWIARAELERAVGGPLSAETPAAPHEGGRDPGGQGE